MKDNHNHNKLFIICYTIIIMALLLSITTISWAENETPKKKLSTGEIILKTISLSRVWVGAIFALAGLVLLMTIKVNLTLRLIFLPIIFFVFSVVQMLPLGSFAKGLGLHPSPICIITKPFVFKTIPPFFLVLLVYIFILTIVGNKLFCGWVCPLGAIQELIHKIPLPKKLKITIPFIVTNIIRLVIFVSYILILFLFGVAIYNYLNPFEALHWGFELVATSVLIVVLIASLFIFRPFCYFICPLGLVTWIFEHLSIVRVKFDKEKCNDCNLCVKKTYCPAVPSILQMKRFRPDCFACGRCIELCPKDALKFKTDL